MRLIRAVGNLVRTGDGSMAGADDGPATAVPPLLGGMDPNAEVGVEVAAVESKSDSPWPCPETGGGGAPGGTEVAGVVGVALLWP